MATRHELFPFRYRDPRTGKRVRARYVAELHEIAARHAEYEIIGPPEIRNVNEEAQHFNPWRRTTAQPVNDLPSEDLRALDDRERFLLLVFLRRYVTYCARRRRFAAMNGAARLHAAVRESIA